MFSFFLVHTLPPSLAPFGKTKSAGPAHWDADLRFQKAVNAHEQSPPAEKGRSKAVFAIFLPALSSSPLHEDAKAANAKAYSQQIIHIPAIRKVFLYFKVLISDIYLYFKVMDLSHSVLPVQYRFLLLLSSSSTSLARSTPAAAAISR